MSIERIVKMHWNEATEQWRMEIGNFTVQELNGDILKCPVDWFNCLSVHRLFDGLDKAKAHNYKLTTELLD
jgi:hypothetical protein